MNFVFFSPNFPPGYYQFGQALKKLGAQVLGLGDCAYDALSEAQKRALTEYYRVDNLANYDQNLRAIGYFTHRYGKIDLIESFNEFWMAEEAQLRTDFNIPGLKYSEIRDLQRKSYMKKIFRQAGVETALGEIYSGDERAEQFALKAGFPLIVKPDTGVGARQTYKIQNLEALRNFIRSGVQEDYFIEAFVNGSLESFDGLTDQNGNIVFSTSHIFSQGIMETVSKDLDLFYYSRREIPNDLNVAGTKIVKALKLRGRFFHIEFFRTNDNRFLALEINLRPPGGLTVDMFNYAHDFDIYCQWALVSMYNQFKAENRALYHVCYIGRKNRYRYQLSHEGVLKLTKNILVQHEPISQAWSAAIGNYGYVIRDQNLDNIFEVVKLILQKEES
jgi:hypothetical protein